MSDYRAPSDRTSAPYPVEETTVRTATVRTVVPPPPDVTVVAPSPRRSVGRYVKFALKAIAFVLLGYVVLVLTLLVAYRWVNPPTTTLIAWQWAGGSSISRTWVPLERISPNLQRAVVMSEDARFCSHGGVDWREIEEAFERSQDGTPRGGSTISMQLAKNLFLWPSKSYVRKALEIPITYGMEQLWSKRRILEIYLNVAEWGPGVFGAEAAAQHHFRKSAARLTETEAALLAVSLPNPILREAGAPTPGTRRLAQIIQTRMRSAGPYVKCLPGA